MIPSAAIWMGVVVFGAILLEKPLHAPFWFLPFIIAASIILAAINAPALVIPIAVAEVVGGLLAYVIVKVRLAI